jgi:hypothetical protein
MENVPKFVWQRLQAPAAEAHPDANLLAAFAEQMLPESERASVVSHLAKCSDCREIVALALPPTETTSVIVVKGVGGGWLNLPALRWGIAAAGLILLTSIGVLEYKQHQGRESRIASLETGNRHAGVAVPAVETPQASTRVMVPEALSPQASPPQTDVIKKEAEGRGVAMSSRERALFRDRKGTAAGFGSGVGPSGGSGEGGSGGVAISPASGDSTAPVSGSSVAVAVATQAPARPMTVPRASESVTVEVQSQAGVVSANTEEAQVPDQLAQNQNNLPLNGRNVTNLDVVKAKDPVPAQGAARAPAAPLQREPALMLAAMPRWAVSSDGSLQRSFDAGKTWQDVDVTAALASKGLAMTVAEEGDSGYPDVDADKSKKKQLAKTRATPVFHAVSAIGSEVWAGGVGAMLYHSEDAGAHWTGVLPASAGVVLTGDITSIQFSDPQHGRIATSNNGVWITDNDGQSWRKQ